MENKIELSPSELELIRIKRDKDELLKQETLANINIRSEQKVVAMYAEIEKFKQEEYATSTSLLEYFVELDSKYPGVYRIKTTDNKKVFQATNYHYNSEQKILDSDGKTFIIKEEILNYTNNVIERISNPEYTIYVIKQQVKKGYSYVTEYRMLVGGLSHQDSNKPLKNVFTAHEKIKEKIETTIRRNDAEKNAIIAWDMLLEDLQKEFSNDNATFKKEEGYNGRNYKSKTVSVRFPNGVEVEYTGSYHNETFSKYIQNIRYSNLDKTDVVNALKNVKLKA